MSEIPNELMETARSIAESSGFTYHFDGRFMTGIHGDCDATNEVEELADAIATALLAERERCANVARDYLIDIAGCDMSDEEPDLIATAILKGPTA